VATSKAFLLNRSYKLWDQRSGRVFATHKNSREPRNVQEVDDAIYEKGCEVAYEESDKREKEEAMVARRKQRLKKRSE
jgi:hypothetical protein